MKIRVLVLWHILLLITLPVLVATMSRALALGGHETQNGGTIVVDGQEVRLADLNFSPLPYDGYEMDATLKARISRFESDLNDVGLSLHRFFEENVFGESVEYRFVGKLPSSCQFIPDENLPVGQRVDVGCTQGSITYLLPAEFAKLDLLQKALLIVHERLHAFAPQESYDVKTELVRGLYILEARYRPAIESRNVGFTFTAEELRIVRALGKRVAQLNGSSIPAWTDTAKYFNADGARIVNSKISGDQVKIGVGSFVKDSEITGSRILVLGSGIDKWKLDGQDVELVNSRISGNGLPASVKVRNLVAHDSSLDIRTEGENIQIENSTVYGPLSGRNIRIERSKTNGISGTEIEIVDSELMAVDTQAVSSLQLRNVRALGRVALQGSRISILSSELIGYNRPLEGCDTTLRIEGDDLVISGSRLSTFVYVGSRLPVSVPNRSENMPWEDFGHDPYDCKVGAVYPNQHYDSVIATAVQGRGIALVNVEFIGVKVSGESIRIENQRLAATNELGPADVLGMRAVVRETVPVINH